MYQPLFNLLYPLYIFEELPYLLYFSYFHFENNLQNLEKTEEDVHAWSYERYKKDINTLKLILNNDTPSPDETSLVFEHSVHNEIEKCSRVVFFECVGKREGGGLFKIINDATDSGVISVTYNGWGKQGRRRWLL